MKAKQDRIVPLGRMACESPIGTLCVEADETGVCKVSLEKKRVEEPQTENVAKILRQAARELEEYFSGQRKVFEVPVSMQGTEFQRAVWHALQEIPYGETRSYGEIAKAIGRPKAARAVGMANHCNPVMIIVPCHRVIGKDGSLTGYAEGLEIKEKLLGLEQGS